MLTSESVLALAPDDASAKAAHGLISPAKWPTLGADDAAVWGECQGSGSKPYQTQVDLAGLSAAPGRSEAADAPPRGAASASERGGLSFRCSCPSRKFPCKHGLALLLLRVQDASRFASPRPAWVDEWLASREQKEKKKEERDAQKAAAPPPDPESVAKREAQRWGRIEAAAQDLERWLADQLARGLGALDDKAIEAWSTMAARMVDAQAPGLGQRLLDAGSVVRVQPDWPERLLHRLGLLQLACDGLQRRASLPDDVQAELRTLAGWPFDKDEVLARGEAVEDRWSVIGVVTQEQVSKLVERRVWLHGQRSGRRAFVLDHAFGGRGFEQAWLAGTSVDATLRFFPGASRLRVIAATVQVAGMSKASDVHAWPHDTLQREWDRITQRVAASPWVWLHPLVLNDAVLLRTADDDSWRFVVDGRSVRAHVGDMSGWRLMAASGGLPVHVAGEWDGESFEPLLAWRAGEPQAAWVGRA
jgi:SWIM zinc finger